MSAIRPVGVLEVNYPEGPLADALEAQIETSLPPIAGLDSAASQGERLKIYEAEIRQQREEFTAMYGDPFGWEKRSEPRGAVAACWAGAPEIGADVN
jgi:hypothetical protein